MKHFLAVIFIFLISGCATNNVIRYTCGEEMPNVKPGIGATTIIYDCPEQPKIRQNINIPNQINFNGKDFYKRFENQDSAEYFLKNDSDYGWKELVTISFFKGVRLDDAEQSLRKIHKNSMTSKTEFYRMGDMLLEISLFSPKDDAKFNSFEANYAIFMSKCDGVSSIRYAKNFDKSNNSDELYKRWKKEIDGLNMSYFKIECR